MNKRMTLMAPFAALALVLTACGDNGGDAGDDGAAAESGGATIVATEFEFSPSDVSIPADTPIDITIDNQGVVEHDWTIDELGVEIYADAGESVTESITAPAGNYEVYCSIPGHKDSGMTGTLTVGD